MLPMVGFQIGFLGGYLSVYISLDILVHIPVFGYIALMSEHLFCYPGRYLFGQGVRGLGTIGER